MDIKSLSLSELRVLLSKVESDLAHIDSEAAICNNIAKSFTGQSLYNKSEYNKLLTDITGYTDQHALNKLLYVLINNNYNKNT